MAGAAWAATLESVPTSTKTLLAVAVVSASVVALAFAATASGHFDLTGQYTHSGCPGTTANRVDPINVVFYDWGTWGRVVSQVESHTGATDTSGSSQMFVDHGSCYPMHAQRATCGPTCSRYHMRVRGQHSDPHYRWPATAGAHHEDWVVSCLPSGWHAVDANGPNGSGFDQGRNALVNAMAGGGHAYFYAWWGNTQNFRQCDGDYAGSDGATSYIRIHQVNH